MVVGIGLVKFQHGEFGIMNCRNAFIPKIPINFKDTSEAADNKPFEIEFRRNPQK